jgi:hypothetical protein
MTIKSLDELRQADERTLRFIAGGGLGLNVAMNPDDSSRHWQEVAVGLELHVSVVETTRRSFDHLRTVFAYGVLCYEVFTHVHDHALLVLEQALRDRFIDYNGGTVMFVRDGTTTEVPIRNYQDVMDFLRHNRNQRLVVQRASGPQYLRFNGMLASLLTWARTEGLLRGGRSRAIEAVLKDMRDAVAHPNGYQLLTPVDAARTLRDLAELINRLWGHDTPGGRLYPAPLTRQTVALAWEPRTGDFCCALAQELWVDAAWDSYSQFALVQAVWDDSTSSVGPQLEFYDSLVETTPYPTEYLWGPGSRVQGLNWLKHHPPKVDTCDPVDRLFVVRAADDRVWRPMRPEVAASCERSTTAGQWYLVRADQPDHALVHVRNVTGLKGRCEPIGPCPGCLAEGLMSGSLTDVLSEANVGIGDFTTRPDFKVAYADIDTRSLPL